MQPELLLFDIGNTCIKVGLADSRGVTTSYNLRTDPAQTSDSLGLTLLELLRHAGAEPRFTACVASSVVPGFDPLLREAVQRYLGCPLWMVPQDMPIPLQNHYERPQEVGADRLVGAYEARRLHPGPESLIVVDFGTAVTFDCISGNAYLGGLIFPGPRTAISALASLSAAAKPPRWVKLPLMAQTTAEAPASRARAISQAWPVWRGSYSQMMPVTDIVVLLGAILYGIAEHFSVRVHFAGAGGRDGLFFLFSFPNNPSFFLHIFIQFIYVCHIIMH